MKIAVLGATGHIGRRVAAELARSQDVDDLLLTGRDETRVRRLADVLGHDRTHSVALDVAVEDVASHIADRDVVVSCVGPCYLFEERLASAAIDAAVPYISLCDDLDALQSVQGLHARAAQRGIAVIPGCSMSPGLSNMLVSLAVAELDEVEEIEIALAVSSADSDGPASAMHFLYTLAAPAPAIARGSRITTRAGTAPKLVFFPEPVGWVETFHVSHPEIDTMMEVHPTVSWLQYRMGLTERTAMDAVRASAFLRLLSSETSRRAWLKLSQPLKPLLERVPPRGPGWTGLRVDVRGRVGGRTAATSYGVADHLVNMASVPLAYGARELGSRRTTEAGVRSVEQVFEPRAFLRAVAERGIRLARLESQPI